jgi:hypothetical protein
MHAYDRRKATLPVIVLRFLLYRLRRKNPHLHRIKTPATEMTPGYVCAFHTAKEILPARYQAAQAAANENRSCIAVRNQNRQKYTTN